jgi:hypothetical protein
LHNAHDLLWKVIKQVAMSASDSSPVPRFRSLLDLKDRGFVVLGAGQGIGRQAVHALA